MKLIWSLAAASGVAFASPVVAQTTTRTPAQLACEMGGACAAAPAAADADADADGPLRPISTGTRPICMFNACKAAAPRAAAPTAALVRRTPPRPPVTLGRSPRLASTPLAASVTGTGTTAVRRPTNMQLQFASGSAELSDAVRGEARKFAQTLTDPTLGMTDAHMTVEGHTSSVGSAAANQDLSQRRAQAVVDYMVSLGVSPGRLRAVGYGPSRPLPGRDGADAANRRVEIAKD